MARAEQMGGMAGAPLGVMLAMVVASVTLWGAAQPANRTRPAAARPAAQKELVAFGCQCDDGTTCIVVPHAERVPWPPVGARAASTIEDDDGHPIGLVCWHADHLVIWKIPAQQT
ncbi:MAG TPA: hypothetical protein VFA81_05750 [Burkholderiales bacterium]|nr:hypothetical protein [Burkholderiales bacterium]